jgi:glutamine amidotransferase-like uncharacterized protein
MKKIALFQHHPECSNQCCDGIIRALSSKYEIKIFTIDNDLNEVLNDVDGVVFPGGIGDSDSYHDFFTRTKANKIAAFLARGGRYIGICMGAYWAGSRYFDILDKVDAVQYIKQPTAIVKRSYGTVAFVFWDDLPYHMFFYDGCTYVGDGKYKTVAKYADGLPMAIIQGNIGLIGCHPESEEFWYDKPYQYIHKYWHDGEHHRLLLEFVDRLIGDE